MHTAYRPHKTLLHAEANSLKVWHATLDHSSTGAAPFETGRSIFKRVSPNHTHTQGEKSSCGNLEEMTLYCESSVQTQY